MPGASATTDSSIDKLETKLFQHTYAKDSIDNRIDRLENLIFGQTQKGSTDERVAALVKAVPNLDSTSLDSTHVDNNAASTASAGDANAPQTDPAQSQQEANTASSHADKTASKQAKSNKSKNIARDDNANGGDESGTDNNIEVGNYPAVTAMETKLLGKDHSNEPIKDRLARLEKKALGAVSTSDDLSERVDKLKAATGIDIARKPGSITDWIDDDQDMTASNSPSDRGGSDFGKHDIYKDMQKAYGSSAAPYRPPKNPFSSPYFPDQIAKTLGISIKSFGLSQQVVALEHEIFGKSYEHDPLPARVNRLETTVFPGQKPSVDKPLPDRIQILLSKVPIRQAELQALAKQYQIEPDNTLSSADNTDPNNTTGNIDPNSTAAIQRSHKHLSKIIGSLGNMLSGGMAGSGPMNGGNYVMDPASGLLIDPNTGYVVNPNTGTMYGTRTMSPYGMGNYGYNGYSGYNNYYNNMYPFGSPMGGMGSGFSIGGGGFGFGFR